MIVTEKKRIKIRSICNNNPVFFTWFDSKGGLNQWLFYKTQTEVLTTAVNNDFEPRITDLETARGHVFDLSIDAQPSMVVFANVDIEDIEGLKTMFHSNSVEVLMNPATWEVDGAIWQSYRVNPKSFQLYNTDEYTTDVEVTLLKPYINTLQR